MTVFEASVKLGVTPARVRHLIASKRILAKPTTERRGSGVVWDIPASALKAVAKRKNGRPKKTIA
jgi:hypothetical protein